MIDYSIKGVSEILPCDSILFRYIEEIFIKFVCSYGYKEVRLPLLEKYEFLKNTIGINSDVISKEMFVFMDKDKNNTLLSLRPEGTSSCVRISVKNGLVRNNQKQRFWYCGQMFRRENPQFGRYRQFNQMGVESFGFMNFSIDLEHILIMFNIFRFLEIEKFFRLEINNIGNFSSRNRYKSVLSNYFRCNLNKLSFEDKDKICSNPFRILDDKRNKKLKVVLNAPILNDYLCDENKSEFECFKNELSKFNINFQVNNHLVRGLDYYDGLVYEWISDSFDSSLTVCAGGRYNTLVNKLSNGSNKFGSGFALGMERLFLVFKKFGRKLKNQLNGYLFFLNDANCKNNILISEEIRGKSKNFSFITHIGNESYKVKFKKAQKSGARFILIIGENELKNKTVIIKDTFNNFLEKNIKINELDHFWRNINDIF